MKMRWLFVFLCAASAFAASPFDGTWKIDAGSAQFPQKPDKFEIKDGIYTCLTCVPELKVKVDGTDQNAGAGRSYDTVNVKILDAHTIEITSKKAGKVLVHQRITVDQTGNRATNQVTRYAPNIKEPLTNTLVQVRVEKGPPESHIRSGAWRTEKVEVSSPNALTITFRTAADTLTMIDGAGESYTAKFDGKDYPYRGDPNLNAVSLRRIDPNIIEETDKRDGKSLFVSRLTVSQDGRSMAVTGEDLQRGTTTKFTAVKQ